VWTPAAYNGASGTPRIRFQALTRVNSKHCVAVYTFSYYYDVIYARQSLKRDYTHTYTLTLQLALQLSG